MDSKGQPQSEIKNPVKDIPGSKDVVPEQISHRLNELEAKLIEQDHRWVNVLIALYTAFTQYDKGDPRRISALKAVLWRVFSPATAATAGIGIISILGVMIGMHANYLLTLQNQRIDQQTLLLEAQRRAGLVSEFTAVIEQIEKERAQFENKRVANRERDTSFKPGAVFQLSAPTVGRIVALSRSYRPYLYLEIAGEADEVLTADLKSDPDVVEDVPVWLLAINHALGLNLQPEGERPKMTKIALSPERGQLLIALVSGNVDLAQISNQFADFSRSDLRKAILSSADLSQFNLTRSSFIASDLLSANLSGAFLAGAQFSRACLSSVNFDGALIQGAMFDDAKLDGSYIPNPEQLAETNLSMTDLTGLYVAGDQWLSRVASLPRPPAGFNQALWKLKKLDNTEIDRLSKHLMFKLNTTDGVYQIEPVGSVAKNRSIC